MHRRSAAILATLGGVAALVIAPGTAGAHGSMETPISRTYACFLEGPETPKSAACQDAVAMGGTQPLYDWNEVNQANAAGNHKPLVPDGKMCSGGRDKYRAFDVPRRDWPSTKVTAGASYTFRYKATAPHPGTFDVYITKDGYNPSQALKWSDLEAAPFLTATNPTLDSNQTYVMNGRWPSGKSGRHLVYSVWQRSDSGEAFYTCSDVVFGNDVDPTPTPTPTVSNTPDPSPSPSPSPTTSATPTPSPSPTQTGSTSWTAGTTYTTGQRVTYNGVTYTCRQGHTALAGWEPPNVAALWERG
ncbi:lytic polysaccharide monooxygenase auxiliary activity family 9 protein [Sinosporangium siamense]|uniref:Chitin-binding type-3 domain-containing protein n=1 Tax=Sinosporangium siamense TaxID=1367973 RepID=A0A919RF71_9ACTN|nr:lytic polysaccharide monooxygenase [Sinosporangium siamense]GII92773.1 hypothetical protein Ssi02_30040 [Sinosporangium siamense]